MVATNRIAMADISRQKRFEMAVGIDGLSRQHTVGQAVEFYREKMGIHDNGLRFTAFARGLKLDQKKTLGEILDEEDTEAQREWTVMGEVSAGSR